MLPAVYVRAGPRSMEQPYRHATWQAGPWDVKNYLPVCFLAHRLLPRYLSTCVRLISLQVKNRFNWLHTCSNQVKCQQARSKHFFCLSFMIDP